MRARPAPALLAGASSDAADIIAFVKARIGGVKAPKELDIWPDLPRSKVGKALKREIRAQMIGSRPAR